MTSVPDEGTTQEEGEGAVSYGPLSSLLGRKGRQNMELTLDELKVLQESLDAWVSAGDSGEILAGLMGAMLVPKDSPNYDEFVAEEKARKVRLLDEKRSKKERAILIQAKLIQLMDQKRAEALVASA